jgi:hypothetical protein
MENQQMPVPAPYANEPSPALVFVPSSTPKKNISSGEDVILEEET